MATKKTAPAKPAYTATVLVMGKRFSGTGATIRDAIAAIQVKNLPKVRGVLTLTKGKVSKDRILMPVVMQRLFALSPTMREFALKQVSTLFDL